MARHLVHQGLRPGRAINLGTFGPGPGEGGRPDVGGFMAEEAADPGGLSSNLNNALTVKRNREAADLAGHPTRSPFGPLPDMAWDGFFGALQKKEQNAEDHNMRFRPNIAGSGPGEGIGHLGFIAPSTGLTVHPLDDAGQFPSIQGLKLAADRVNRRY